MRGRLLVAGLVVVLLEADAPKADPAKEEAAKLEGTWTVVSQTSEQFLPEQAQIQKMVIKGERLILMTKKLESVSEFTIDPSKDPKHLDRTITEGKLKGRVLPGIYQLDGDELKYCYNDGSRGKERTVRPTELKGDFLNTIVLLVLKREKPEKP